MSQLLTGSICLSDIPRDQIKKVMCRDGKERYYLNIAVVERKTPQTFTREDGRQHTYTHFISCAPKKEERIDGVNYYISELETRGQAPMKAPSAEDIYAAPSIGDNEELPF